MTMNAHIRSGGSSYPSPEEKGIRQEDPNIKAAIFLKHMAEGELRHQFVAHSGTIVISCPNAEYHIPIHAIQAHKR